MHPSKSMVDYMMELNRLFPKTTENDAPAPFTTPLIRQQSPFSQWTPNYSSSSTDSYSPETFPDLLYNRPDLPRVTETPRVFSETSSISATPFQIARRPIVGRKILGNSELKPLEASPDFKERFDRARTSFETPMSPIKHWSDPQTPPNTNNMCIGQKNSRNVFYELFPGENRGFEFKTPVKNPSVHSNMSPTSPIFQTSPVPINLGMFTPPQYRNPYGAKSPMLAPNVNRTSSPMTGIRSPMDLGAMTSRSQDGVPKTCTFCRKNGETPVVYMTHCVKEKRGNRNVVTCPILRSHVCSRCGVSGDNAHTITYCPVLRNDNNGMPLKSTTITLKNTRIKSNGRRRY